MYNPSKKEAVGAKESDVVDTVEETTSTEASEVGIKDIPEKEAVGANGSDVVGTVKETTSTKASDVGIKDMPEKEAEGAKERDVVDTVEETTSKNCCQLLRYCFYKRYKDRSDSSFCGSSTPRIVENERNNWRTDHLLLYISKEANETQTFKSSEKMLQMCYTEIKVDRHIFKHYFITNGKWVIEFQSDSDKVSIHSNQMHHYVNTEYFDFTEDVQKRIEQVVGANNYSLVFRNSEHLCTFVRTGAWISSQMMKNAPLRKIFEPYLTPDQIKLINKNPKNLANKDHSPSCPMPNEVGDYFLRFCGHTRMLTETDSDIYNILVIGPTGSGKSSIINYLFNKNVSTVRGSASSVTKSMTYMQGEVMWTNQGKLKKGHMINIIDSVGFCDTEISKREVHNMIKNSVNANNAELDKVVIICSGRIEETHAVSIKKFMKWLEYEKHKQNFVLIYNKCDKLNEIERNENLAYMCSILGVDPNMHVVVPSNPNHGQLRMNQALGFPPRAPFEEIKEDLQSLKDIVFFNDFNSKPIPVAVNQNSCKIQ